MSPIRFADPARKRPEVPERIKQLQRERVQPEPPLKGAKIGRPASVAKALKLACRSKPRKARR